MESHEEEKQKEVLKEEIKTMKQHEMICRYQGLPRHVRSCPLNEEEASAVEMKNWTCGYRAFQRGALKIKINTIDDNRGGR